MSAKANILAKLKKSLEGTTPVVDDYDESLVTQPWSYAPEQRIARLRQLMEAVHTE
ncbi:MAG TPA: lactate utilization protein, partial [Pseudomonas sp.]|nr:lactate utilization protein [Pseudomonas sp.]HBB80099.1 lactate utilization protein [Pseudomonas sp.]